MIKKNRSASRNKIKVRIRKKVSGTTEVPRLTIYRSLHYIYAQIVDDSQGKTLLSASSNSKELRDEVKGLKKKTEISKLVGTQTAKKALGMNIKRVVFDRNGYRYHGHVKALADGAREGGLQF